MHRHQHSVVDVSMRLNGALRGSGDPIPNDEAKVLVSWLKWRITEGWERPTITHCAAIDSTVREVAEAVVNAWEAQHGNAQPPNDVDYFDESVALADMLWSGEVISVMGIAAGDPTLALLLNCSDTFAWGCADAEPITLEDLPALYTAWQTGVYGTTSWVCKKRGRRPQAPLEKRMREAGAWDDEMEALP